MATSRSRRLGPILCWAVVFADIGTSIYYTPGILFGQVGVHAALFVSLTLVVFILLTIKYAEVAWRYPEGGGVVTVATRAIHPFVGMLGGLLILVDYFLTAALSALSGLIYLSVVVKPLGHVVLGGTAGALLLLAMLNLVGVRASAMASAVFAVAAAAGQLAVVLAVIIHVGPTHLLQTFPRMLSGPRLTPLSLLTGYAGAFLAFSGLESIAQLSPSMAEPRRRVARQGMLLVVITIAVTSPLLTLWSTTLVDVRHADPNQFISLLGGVAGGPLLASGVAVSAALLLIFASNTALIGSYHVFLALSRMRFLPRLLQQRNRWRDTPHWAIMVATAIPLGVVILSRGNVGLLGDLYAFGLLGAFSLTCLSLDIVRWHARTNSLTFAVGVVTTALVSLAWITNLFAKPNATLFGGVLTVVGLVVAITTYLLEHRRGIPVVFPHILRAEGAPAIVPRHRWRPAAVMALLPHQRDGAEAVIRAGIMAAAGRPIAFVYRESGIHARRAPGLMEIVDPYLDDLPAQQILGRAERAARHQRLDRRYVYITASSDADAIDHVWDGIQAEQALATAGDEASLSQAGSARVDHFEESGTPLVRRYRRD